VAVDFRVLVPPNAHSANAAMPANIISDILDCIFIAQLLDVLI
jgi:hypothetical protein